MTRCRQLKCIVAVLVSCAGSGCVAFHTTRPVELVLAHTESANPVANTMVTLNYNHSMFQGAPSSVTGSTDENGCVVLPVAGVDFRMTLQAGRATFRLDRDIIRTGGVLTYRDDEVDISLRVVPKSPTLLQRLFGFGWYGTAGAL